jgi:hypothetical protein
LPKEDEHSHNRLAVVAGHIGFGVEVDIPDCKTDTLVLVVPTDNLLPAARTVVAGYAEELAIVAAEAEVRHLDGAAQEADYTIVVLDSGKVGLRDKVVVVQVRRRQESLVRPADHRRQDERTCSSRCDDVESIGKDGALRSLQR